MGHKPLLVADFSVLDREFRMKLIRKTRKAPIIGRTRKVEKELMERLIAESMATSDNMAMVENITMVVSTVMEVSITMESTEMVENMMVESSAMVGNSVLIARIKIMIPRESTVVSMDRRIHQENL